MRVMKVMLWFAAALLTTAGWPTPRARPGPFLGGWLMRRRSRARGHGQRGVAEPAGHSHRGDVRATATTSSRCCRPATYKVTFELSGFQRQERTVNLAPTQVLPLEVSWGRRRVTETVEVVGRSADVLLQTAQVATNFSAGTARDAADHARHQRGAAAGAGGSRDRPVRRLLDRRLDVVREPVPGQRRDRQREPARPAATTCTSRTRFRRRRSRPPASRPSTAGSAAASSTSSPSRAATCSADRSATRSTTTTGGASRRERSPADSQVGRASSRPTSTRSADRS